MGRLVRGLGIAVAAAVIGTAAFSARPATATDLAELKARAQAIADEVTGLERRLRGLEAKQARLDEQIERHDYRIAALELEVDAAEDAYQVAHDRFVARAVESYKAGGVTDSMALMLSADDIGEVLTIAEASSRASELDAEAVEHFLKARDDARALQDEIAARKATLLAARTEATAVASDIQGTVDDRHETLQSLTAEIEKLQAEIARRTRSTTPTAPTVPAAPQPSARTTSASLLERLEGTGPSGGVPKGFTSTGVSFEGLASWYGPGFEGNPTATGDIFDSSLYTVASKELPLNSYLYITRGDRGLVVLVNDRGPYVEPRILDLSRGSAEALDMIHAGVGWVRAEIIVRN